MTTPTKRLLAVEAALPAEAARALDRFTTMNPHWRGAGWADCLDVLHDSDSNLEVTEPTYEALHESGTFDDGEMRYVGLVALTLFYADGEAPTVADVEAAVRTVAALYEERPEVSSIGFRKANTEDYWKAYDEAAPLVERFVRRQVDNGGEL